MIYLTTITSQGQLSIPMVLRNKLGIKSRTKATIKVVKNGLLIEPKLDFDALAGSLKSPIKLSDKQLDVARSAFEKQWAEK